MAELTGHSILREMMFRSALGTIRLEELSLLLPISVSGGIQGCSEAEFSGIAYQCDRPHLESVSQELWLCFAIPSLLLKPMESLPLLAESLD